LFWKLEILLRSHEVEIDEALSGTFATNIIYSCLSKHGESPPLTGLNLMYCGSWNWCICRLCNL